MVQLWTDDKFTRVITKQAQTNAIEIDSETFMKEGEALVAKMTADCLKVKVSDSLVAACTGCPLHFANVLRQKGS